LTDREIGVDSDHQEDESLLIKEVAMNFARDGPKKIEIWWKKRALAPPDRIS
jgi:hypothetical protein